MLTHHSYRCTGLHYPLPARLWFLVNALPGEISH